MEVTVRVPAGVDRVAVLGSSDRNLKMLREAVGVAVTSRDGVVRLNGDRLQVSAARRVLERLIEANRRGRRGGGVRREGEGGPGRGAIGPSDGSAEGFGAGADSVGPGSPDFTTRQGVLDLIGTTLREVTREGERHAASNGGGGGAGGGDIDGWADSALGAGEGEPIGEGPWSEVLNVYVSGRPVEPRTENQRRYLDAIRENEVVFGIGPAGTGKTYLAVAAAVHMLKAGVVRRVVLARPAVEAGERLGFLPGDLQAKVNPYLRPLLDALHEMMDFGTLKRFMMSDVIEIVPLAYMRGRTLNRSAIILDEAQNTTRGQMKMFLTRMGQGSRVIVTGDTTQIDLPDPTQSGLVHAGALLRGVRGIGMVQFGEADIVRHAMVQRIVEAYARADDVEQDATARGGAAPGPGRHEGQPIGRRA